MSTTEENILEIINILRSVNCPLIVRTDEWWIEELLFTPGKPRKDLIVWITSKAIESALLPTLQLQLKLQDLDTTASSSSSSNIKLPESDEAILSFWCGANVCSKNDLPFIKGDIPKNDQIKYWFGLIKPLETASKLHVNTTIAFGSGTLSNIVSRENFLDAFSMKASLLSADVQSEIKQIHKMKERNHFTKKQIVLGNNLENDTLLISNIKEQAKRLKTAADQFNDIFESDLKICLPKYEASVPLIEFGDEINNIRAKFTVWKKSADSLLELQQSACSETNLKKSENLLKRSIKDKSFPPFQKLCGSD